MSELPSWNIMGNIIEWCTETPGSLISSPTFTINDNDYFFEILSDCRDDTTFYSIKFCQKYDPGVIYTPILVTVYPEYITKMDNMENVGQNDYFKLIFELDDVPDSLPPTIKREVPNEVDVYLPQPNMENMSQDVSDLPSSSAYSDVRLACKDGVLQAHKVVLAARSKVFSAMFSDDMEESLSDVDMSDVNVTAIKLFLEFVYTGNIQELPSEIVPTLYSLGYKYDVDSLSKMCSCLMIFNLSNDNYIQYFHLATSHNDEHFLNALGQCIYDGYLNSANQSDRVKVIYAFKESFALEHQDYMITES